MSDSRGSAGTGLKDLPLRKSPAVRTETRPGKVTPGHYTRVCGNPARIFPFFHSPGPSRDTRLESPEKGPAIREGRRVLGLSPAAAGQRSVYLRKR
jgi:hypothetical protein